MAILVIYFYALNVWASEFIYPLDFRAFILVVALPLLPIIPLAIWYFTATRTSSLLSRTQRVMRTSAGHEEVFIRERETTNINQSDPDNSG